MENITEIQHNELSELLDRHKQEKLSLYNKFVRENHKYKVGDTVEDFHGLFKITGEPTFYNSGISTDRLGIKYPGYAITKKGSPVKAGHLMRGYIIESDIDRFKENGK